MKKILGKAFLLTVGLGMLLETGFSNSLEFDDQTIGSRNQIMTLEGGSYQLKKNTFIYAPVKLSANTIIDTAGYTVFFCNNMVLNNPSANPLPTITKANGAQGTIMYLRNAILNNNLTDVTTQVLPANDVLYQPVNIVDLNGVELVMDTLNFNSESGPEVWQVGAARMTVKNKRNVPTQRVIAVLDGSTIRCDYPSYPNLRIEQGAYFDLYSQSIDLNHLNWNGSIFDSANYNIGLHDNKPSSATVTFSLHDFGNISDISIPTGVAASVYKTIVNTTDEQSVILDASKLLSENLSVHALAGQSTFVFNNCADLVNKNLEILGSVTATFHANAPLIFTQPLCVGQQTIG